jgi:predicted DNA-binding transcriptional regulator AlpA
MLCNKIRARIIELGMSIPQIASSLGMNRSTMYRKLKDPGRFTVAELRKLVSVLQWSGQEVRDIFMP